MKLLFNYSSEYFKNINTNFVNYFFFVCEECHTMILHFYFITVYSQFAMCEYLVVATNILFHATALIDFSSTGVLFVLNQGHKTHLPL